VTNSRRRVVITGLGCVTALGETAEILFSNLCEGRSGISPIELFDSSAYPVRFGGEVKGFEPARTLDAREARRMDRFTQLAAASAVEAVKDSGIDFTKEDAARCGAIVGSGIGGLKEIEEQHVRLLQKGPSKVSPFCVPKLMGNAASGTIAILFGLKGPNICVVSACASGSHAIGEGMCSIQYGRSDIIIAGGSEAALTPLGLASFCSLKSLSTRNDDPQAASRPFDRDRDGFVLSEGAGIVVLEEYEHAKKRGAKIYAEMIGYGATDDAHHITAPNPDGEGAAEAMRVALADGGVSAEDLSYINAHGTSTELNDAAESKAIRAVMGDHAGKVMISSTKSSLGHLLGASGAVELIICAKAIEKGVVPPTINLDNPDPNCGPLDFVPKTARQANVKVVANNSFGFGGHNACLVLKKL
jgi:3-oxoacyl-[acyl-carrier-protein] synthase II